MKKNLLYNIYQVGVIHNRDRYASIEIFDEYRDALLGLKEFSHIIVLTWFHKNDTEEKRNILRVHPRGDKKNPLTGVFATRSPIRPNPIALFTCRIVSIRDNIIQIDKINAFDGSPVIDIKPYIPEEDSVSDVEVPGWLK